MRGFMHNIDDCLFKTSFSVSIEGAADTSAFERRMENEFKAFVKHLGLEPISSSPELWSFRLGKEAESDDQECINLTFWFLEYIASTFGYAYLLDELKRGNFTRLKSDLPKYPVWALDNRFKLSMIHEAFIEAYRQGLIKIPFNGFVFKNQSLSLMFELETQQTIYQYTWRTRWVLTLVNFLVNSLKTSKRIFPKGMDVIHLFRMRLSKKLSRRD
jgi:hypothetical protein